VWLHPTFDNGIVHFDADSDAVIVKGLVALVLLVYNDRTPQEIVASNDDLRSELGLDQHLSQNRSNGLASMLKQLRLYALAYSMRKVTS
jgi:cysteine desulfuration protein SufE